MTELLLCHQCSTIRMLDRLSACQPVRAQFAIEFRRAFFGEENPRVLELDPPPCSRNSLRQPMRPLDAEVEIVRTPDNQRRRFQLAQLRFHRQRVLAIEGGQKVLEMDRSNGLARWLLTTAYEWKGDFSKAIDLEEETAVLYGETKEAAAQRFTRLRRAYERLGPKEYWRMNLEQQLSQWKTNPGDPYNHAVFYARVGKNLEAFTWLGKAYQVRSQELIFGLRTEPAFDAMRSDPNYTDLVHRIGFPAQDR